ncbi:MAG: HD domain-containing protein [Planctomycetota bacterium]
MKKLRDAVHKDIRLSAAEVAAMDTAEMQRLRGIRQLGAAYLVYPSAQHTRFEHGLGTLWMARRIVSQIESGTDFTFPDQERQAVFLAALVHDATHIPFGHTFEDERRLLERHDESEARFGRLLAGGELGEVLRASPAGRLALELLRPGGEPPEGRAYLRQIVSGTVCADLLDYLKRDNYFCGLSYEFDERVFHYFRIAEGRLAVDMQHGGILRRDALTEITNLLRIRYVLSERVYYHHAKIAAGVMISKAVQRAMEAGLREEDLCTLSDGTLLYRLSRDFGDDEGISALMAGLRARRLYKRVYMASRQIGEENVRRLVARYHLNRNGEREEAERRIAEALGEPRHRVAVYCAPAGMALKEAEVPVLVPGGRMTLLSRLNSDEIQVLKQKHRALWTLYVFISPELGGIADEAGRVSAQIIGHPNELPARRRGSVL